jgi:UDPglucose 6-dehydrogenase
MFHDPYKGAVLKLEYMPLADVLFYCVNEPNGVVTDTSLIEKMEHGLVIIKTTVRVGETARLQHDLPFVKIVFMPEFLSEDTCLDDFMHPDRLVYGSLDPEFSKEANDLFIGLEAPRFFLGPEEAELVKLCSNAYPIMKLVFFNQIYDYCEANNVDYDKVAEALKASRYNSGHYMEISDKGGRGGGGKCFPKDLDILLANPRMPKELLNAVKKINDGLLKRYPKNVN